MFLNTVFTIKYQGDLYAFPGVKSSLNSALDTG